MTTQAKPTSTRQAGGATITGVYGNGGDGVLSVVGTYTQTTERQWQTLTIPSGGAYKPSGHRTMVRGTCTIDAGGSFNDDGNSGASGGAAISARQWLGGGGGAGGASRNTTGSGNLGGGSGGNSSPNDSGAAPAGGTGGQGSGAYLGGAGGGAAAPSPSCVRRDTGSRADMAPRRSMAAAAVGRAAASSTRTRLSRVVAAAVLGSSGWQLPRCPTAARSPRTAAQARTRAARLPSAAQVAAGVEQAGSSGCSPTQPRPPAGS